MYDPGIHHRRSIRLRGYDYSRPGAYFVTICAHLQTKLFGEIVEGEMQLNDVGKMIFSTWHQMPEHYPGCRVDVFVVMPNHIHGILVIEPSAGALSLPDLVHRFKSLTTARYRNGSALRGWAPLNGKLWQRNYYEHVIRNARELSTIREYIETNPLRGETDWENILGA